LKTYLVEAYSDEIEFYKDSIIVALTPEACYQLDKKGIKYSIIEDFYDSVELSNQVEEYRRSVFRWIEKLDEFLLNNINGLKLKSGTIYRWYLKGMVLDPLYIRSYTLRHLFDAILPTEITYFVQKPAAPQLNDQFDNYGRSLYSQVIPIICREENIPLKTVLYEANGEKDNIVNLDNLGSSLIDRLIKTLYKSKILRRLYFILRLVARLPHPGYARKKKINILLGSIAHIGEDFVAEALTRGYRIYLLSDSLIYKYSWYGTRKYLNLDAERQKRPGFDSLPWQSAAGLLKGNDLLKWINEKCQLDASDIVLPRLEHFILNNIDIFFTPSASYLREISALAAANHHPKVKTACLVHGDAVYDSRVWNMTELENYDIHISSNNETAEYFKRLADEIHSSARLYSNPHRLRKIIKIASAREKKGIKAARKNRVVYAPLFMNWDAIRMEGYPTDTYYYHFQKSLVEHFSKLTEYTFVWKGLLHADLSYNPIPDFIRDNHFNNIEIAYNPLTEYLLTADRIICDCPSTGFYEAVIAGVPVMSLYHKSLILRPTAIEYFGDLLKPFSNIPEALKHIDDFLNSDPQQYKMKIDMEKGSIFGILEGIDKEKPVS
jgi:hypothetical protein